jgi:predicted nucleic acid-binding protein
MNWKRAESMIGLDTGFFIELVNGNEQAVTLWRSCLDDKVELVVSCLTLFEIERLGLKGKLRETDTILEAISAVAVVVWPNREILSRAARLSHGLGISALDSLILASLTSREVNEIYTTDSDLETYHSKDIMIRNLRRLDYLKS